MTITERQVLKPGTNLLLDGRKCTILGVMGAGTSCIAYKAQMKLTIEGKTASRTIVLKELYPAHQNIIRETDNSLIIPENYKALFEEESESFVKAAILQFEFHNEEDLTNFTSDIEVVYELNNTLYSVTGIVSGKSYDKINPENITSILKVGESLSHAISYYHEGDYLNLDIKPSNIFYENLPGDNVAIKLFDFNTVCTKEEASQGKFSYSEGYAAPEVRAAKKGSGKFSEVREQADIYSIGAVIFEKIMGRIPKASDQRAGKRWKFENNPYLKDAVPQLQKGIIDLFRKTLAIDKNDRYSSAKELISDLEKIIKFAGIEVFLKNQRISPCTPKDIYISRKDILSKISKVLDEKHILYLHSIGGSGKSETAREYAEQYADKYDFIQFVFYSDSLKKTIANLDFVGLEDKDRFAYTDEDIDRLYKYKYGLLGNAALYGTNTLLIIDNYDYNVDPTSEEYQQNYKIIRELKKLNIHILFTTRVKPEDDTECLDLENMSEEELQTLFFRINPKDKNDPDRIEQVKEIIEVSYKHTMTVKLVAMQSAKYLKPLSEYIDILKTSGLNSGIKGRVTNEKDDESVTMSTVYDHIKALFDFERLSEKQRYIMVNACLLPLSGLETAVFSKYIDLEHFDGASGSDCLDESIEDLVNSGWIEYADTSEKRFTSETKITLHPLICDIVKNELKPELTENKCEKFYESFLNLIDEWGNRKVSGENCLQQEKLMYSLFSNIYTIYEDEHISKAINYILLSSKKISIKNHIIISDDKIIMYFGNNEKLVIPDSFIEIGTFCGYTSFKQISIAKIGNSAFNNCSSLTQITIPDTVTEIGWGAFKNCSSLKEITIPNSITEIRDSTFSDCSSLTQITIPDSIICIRHYAFSNCSSLTQIHISDNVTEIGDHAFDGCFSLTKIVIPNGVTEIGWETFKDCSSLKEINIPNSITKIGDNAFEGCSSLTKIAIPNGVTEIGCEAFKDCSSLKKINIPNSITKIGENAFEGCTSLDNIKIHQIGNSFQKQKYKYDKHLKELNISLGKTEIEEEEFKDCTSLTKISIPYGVTKIGNSAFEGCSSLTQITIPDSIIEIGWKAFSGCSSLTQITIPDSVTEILECAFSDCSSLMQITIPDRVTKIGTLTFFDCSSLTQVSIPNSVTTFESRVFENCSSLTQIIIPDRVSKIGAQSFKGCSSLKKIIIPNSVTKIGSSAFESCSSLTQITIPNSVTEIGWETFKECSSLKKITISDGVTKIGSSAFESCSSLTQVTIPESVTKIGASAFEGCNRLNNIIILNQKIDLFQTMIGYYTDKNGLYRKKDDMTIKGYKNSTAEQYAQEHGFKFVPLD